MKKLLNVLLFTLFALVFGLRASDEEASAAYNKGYKLYENKEYYKALKLFEESELLASSPTIRANSVKAQIGAARMCRMLWTEFQAIEKLLGRYPEYADAAAEVDREYELGKLYFQGEREPAFYAVRAIPWLTGPDKTEEIYSAALKRAPYARQAPGARLRLASIYDEAGKVAKSMAELRVIIDKHPESAAYRWALLALAHSCYELSLRGDGDGRYAKESRELYETFLKKYPKAPEAPEVRRKVQLVRDAQAATLKEMALFYRQSGRADAAGRYLEQIVKDFPDSLSAGDSEAMLTKMDKSYVPGDFLPSGQPRVPKYRAERLPASQERVLMLPGEKGNHALLAIPDFSPYLEKENK